MRLVGVIGSPIAHSLSPLLHNAAFAALGLAGTWRSLAFEVAPGQAADALDAMRRADISGLSVTMPHKADVAALVDECTDVARRLDAVNCVVNRDGVLLGTNTDGEGFVASLARGAAFDPPGGGAWSSAPGGRPGPWCWPWPSAGPSRGGGPQPDPRAGRDGRRAGRSRRAGGARRRWRRWPRPSGRLTWWSTPRRSGWPARRTGRRRATTGWCRPALLHAGQVAADLVYAPRPDALAGRRRRRRAHRAVDGLGMLVHQAAAQMVLWTGWRRRSRPCGRPRRRPIPARRA